MQKEHKTVQEEVLLVKIVSVSAHAALLSVKYVGQVMFEADFVTERHFCCFVEEKRMLDKFIMFKN